MRAVRIGAVGLREGRTRIQFRGIDAGPFRKVSEADRAVGAGDAHEAIADLEVAGAGLERFGGDFLELATEVTRRALHADAAGRDRSRAAGAETGGDLVGVALQDVDALRRHTELLGDELRVSRLVALPARLGADQDRNVAVGIEPHLGGLLSHRAADLYIGGETDAAHEALLLRRLGALGKFLPVGDFHRALHMRGEVAGIVDLSGRGLVGHRLRRNEVLAPDRVRRHAELACRRIDQPFDHISRLRPPGAAIGIDRHGIGEHGAHAAMEGLDVVEPGQHAGAAVRNVWPEGREICAHVAHQVDVHAQELAVLGQRHLRGGDVVAALRVAYEVIGAVSGPFDGLAQLFRRN